MAQIVYQGSLPAVVVDVGGRMMQATKGEPIEVPDWFADDITQQKVWVMYEEPKPEPKSKAAVKKDDDN